MHRTRAGLLILHGVVRTSARYCRQVSGQACWTHGPATGRQHLGLFPLGPSPPAHVWLCVMEVRCVRLTFIRLQHLEVAAAAVVLNEVVLVEQHGGGGAPCPGAAPAGACRCQYRPRPRRTAVMQHHSQSQGEAIAVALIKGDTESRVRAITDARHQQLTTCKAISNNSAPCSVWRRRQRRCLTLGRCSRQSCLQQAYKGKAHEGCRGTSTSDTTSKGRVG